MLLSSPTLNRLLLRGLNQEEDQGFEKGDQKLFSYVQPKEHWTKRERPRIQLVQHALTAEEEIQCSALELRLILL
jgi:hypothetical protein